MTTPNDGGPAFPCGLASGHIDPLHHGLTLRDYFAAKAMQAGVANNRPAADAADWARWAYQMADAMLKAREAA